MDGLRWLLLVAGIIVIAVVYITGRRRSQSSSGAGTEEGLQEPLEPDLGGGVDILVDDDVNDDVMEPIFVDAPPGGDAAAEPVIAAAEQQKIVTLRLVARNRGNFKGDDLVLSLRGIGMRHGKFGIFHRLDGDDEDATIFSAASLVEPGSFDLANIREQQIPGISLFLVLPGPVDGAEAFDMMMEAARTVAQALDGELLDESGSNLSIQRERYMREEIIQFEHSHRAV